MFNSRNKPSWKMDRGPSRVIGSRERQSGQCCTIYMFWLSSSPCYPVAPPPHTATPSEATPEITVLYLMHVTLDLYTYRPLVTSSLLWRIACAMDHLPSWEITGWSTRVRLRADPSHNSRLFNGRGSSMGIGCSHLVSKWYGFPPCTFRPDSNALGSTNCSCCGTRCTA